MTAIIHAAGRRLKRGLHLAYVGTDQMELILDLVYEENGRTPIRVYQKLDIVPSLVVAMQRDESLDVPAFFTSRLLSGTTSPPLKMVGLVKHWVKTALETKMRWA